MKGTQTTGFRWAHMNDRRIVAVCLVTNEELGRLGASFDRAWPIDETPCFSGLLEAIDQAERELWRERDNLSRQPLNQG
jgi:hypothetical protein